MSDSESNLDGVGPVTDPVCGEKLKPEDAVASSEFQGRTFYFQHIKCKMLFERDPEKYLSPTPVLEQGEAAPLGPTEPAAPDAAAVHSLPPNTDIDESG